nr:hypothetical protein [Tanacetum cinerariifolium]
MAYFVAILTPDKAWSCVMQCTFPTKRMRSIISMVSVSLEGFLPSILLLVVIIVAVVIVAVILVVIVIDTIVGVVIVVASIGICASVSGPLVCEICWWLPLESELVDERLLLPPKQTPPEVDKQSYTSLLLDLLAGYTDERDDIINIVSLRKYSSLDSHFNPLKPMKSKH